MSKSPKEISIDGLTGESYKIFKEELTPIVNNLFQKIHRGYISLIIHEEHKPI